MIEQVSILGLDTGLAHFGYAAISFRVGDPSPSLGITPDGDPVFGVTLTDKSDKKRQVASTDDNIRRCRELVPPLLRLLQDSCSHLNVRALAVESMSYPRNSAVVAQIGLAFGVVATLSEIFNLPIVQLSPKEIKKRLCRNGSASKAEVEKAVVGLYPGTVGLVAPGVKEHPYDALAVAHASLDTDIIRMVRQIVRA